MNPAHFANLLAKKNVICIAESSHFEPDTIGNFKLTIDKREISGPQLAIKSGPLRCLVPRHDRAMGSCLDLEHSIMVLERSQ